MRRRIAGKLRDPRALVVVVGLLLAVAWAGPSLGASVGKLARLALGRANEAFHNADLAINASNTAKSTANSANQTAGTANVTANAARSAAASAQSAANTAQANAFAAQATANQALAKANSIVTASYGRMDQPCTISQPCSFDHAKGITAIRQTSTPGDYCVSASGRSPSGTSAASWLVSVDIGDVGTATAPQTYPDSNLAGCVTGEFGVRVTVGSGNPNEVAFFVVIP